MESASADTPYEREYLPAIAFKALAALAEVVVTSPDYVVTPEKVAENVDRYMSSFNAKRRWIVPLALCVVWIYPIRYLRPPFPSMAKAKRREFVERHFILDVSRRRIRFLRRAIQAMARLSQQMVFLGYYADLDTFDSVGYQRFSDRDRSAAAIAAKAVTRPRLTSLDPGRIPAEVDVVVVGSGAGGSIAAYRIAEAGRSVLVLEGGRHVDPQSFSEDEVVQLSRLYADGALQQSRDFSFQILQGKCVGGSTTVNNAVCFDLPDHVLQRWNGQLEAGIDAEALKASFAATRECMQVGKPPSEVPQGGATKFVEGVENLGLGPPEYKLDPVDANIADCPGSGYCNIGCKFGNKLSMLDTVLPDGRQQFGERFQVLPRCHVEKIEHANGRATGVVASLDGRRIRVGAKKTVVVSGGAIASPWLLMSSGIARGRAGKRLCFNMGSPITAYFEKEELNSFDGVQISHYLEPPPERGFVIETWFNPVVSQALNMPGWLDDHWKNMHRFPHLTAAGALVGTTTEKAYIRRALTGGPDVVYEPGRGDPRNREDMERMIDGLKLVGRIFLAAGADCVMPNTYAYHEFTSEAELETLGRYVKDASDLAVGTGHPQGGNAMSADPGRGVVGPDCRVHGFENLFVCDASVFPSATTVNPQLTVMAVANMVAPGIAASD